MLACRQLSWRNLIKESNHLHNVDLVELLDTDLDPVQIVAAAPSALLENGGLPKRQATRPKFVGSWCHCAQ